MELASIAWIMPIAAMISLNAALAGFAAWVNDAACRDVARAAAQQPTKERALVAAGRALKAFVTRNNYTTSPELLLDDSNFNFEIFADKDGKPQLEKAPYVKVTTKMDVRLAVPVLYASDGFTNKLEFKQSYSYPILSPGDSTSKSP